MNCMGVIITNHDITPDQTASSDRNPFRTDNLAVDVASGAFPSGKLQNPT